MKMRWQILLFGGLLVVVAAGAFWLGRDFAAKPPAASEGADEGESAAGVQTGKIREGTITEVVEAYGAMQPKMGTSVTVSVPFEARVLRVLATTGEQVKPETPLVEVGPTAEVELQLKQAQDAFDAAQRSLEQVRRRFQEQLATNSDVTTAEAAERSARSQMESLKQKGVGTTRQVAAGVAGLVSQISVQPGQVVASGTGMVTIAPSSEVEAIVGVSPALAGMVRLGETVSLRAVYTGGEKGNAVDGEVKRVGAEVNPQTQLCDVAIAPAGGRGQGGVVAGGVCGGGGAGADEHGAGGAAGGGGVAGREAGGVHGGGGEGEVARGDAGAGEWRGGGGDRGGFARGGCGGDGGGAGTG